MEGCNDFAEKSDCPNYSGALRALLPTDLHGWTHRTQRIRRASRRRMRNDGASPQAHRLFVKSFTSMNRRVCARPLLCTCAVFSLTFFAPVSHFGDSVLSLGSLPSRKNIKKHPKIQSAGSCQIDLQPCARVESHSSRVNVKSSVRVDEKSSNIDTSLIATALPSRFRSSFVN